MERLELLWSTHKALLRLNTMGVFQFPLSLHGVGGCWNMLIDSMEF